MSGANTLSEFSEYVIRPSALLRQDGECAVFYPSPAGGERRVVVCEREWERLEAENRGRLAYAEREYYAYHSDGAPAGPPRPATVDEAIEQMAAKGKANRPALAGRLDSAAELVRDGRVVLDGETAKVGPYTITPDNCNCADYVHRGGWCKHRLAARMARHLVANGFGLPAAEETTPRPIISEANRRLIESGEVVERERRTRLAYLQSGEGARRWALMAMSQGARTLPADIARRARIAPRCDE